MEQQLQALKETVGTGQTLVAASNVKTLAGRIVGDCFNYLSSFAQGRPRAEVVELKAFQRWWEKFEKKLDVDPTFLERA